MSSLKRILVAIVGVTGAGLVTTACLPQNGLGSKQGGSDSVVASIDGISDQDRARDGLTYTLVCGDVKVKGEPKADKSAVSFAGDKIKDKDLCAMEISLAKDADKLDYDWFGVANGKPLVGLLYGSDQQQVLSGKLLLTLYKLYSQKDDSSFTGKLNITFDVTDVADLPEEAKTKASLVCGDSDKYPGDYKKDAGGKDGVLTFPNLKVKELKGLNCDKVVVLVDNSEAFAGSLTGVSFAAAKKGDELTFPTTAGSRFTVKSSKINAGGVDAGTQPGGLCLHYENSKCLDVRSSLDLAGELPFAGNIVLTRVKGKAGDDGAVVTLLAAAGLNGVIGALPAKSFTTDDLNKALSATDAAGKNMIFFHDVGDADLLKLTFDDDFVQGKHLTKATEGELTNLSILSIEKIYVHGFHKVDETTLNAAPVNTVWMSKVKATRNDAQEVTLAEFIVTGKTKYFTSPAAPLTVDGKASYFSFPTLASEMASAAGSDKWSVYALKGGAMADASCGNERATYLDGLSALNASSLKQAPNAGLDACEITKAKFDATLATGYTISADHYVWEWFEAKK